MRIIQKFLARLSLVTLTSSFVLSSFASVLPAFAPTAMAFPTATTCTPQDSNLVAYWKLDEGAGTTAADSKGGNPGSIVGTLSWSIQKPSLIGFSDPASLNFNGTDAIVTVGDVSALQFDTADAFSVSTWLNGTAFSGYQVIAHKIDDAAATKRGYLFVLNAGVPEVWIINDYGTNNYLRVAGGSALGTGAWHHLAFSYDGSGVAAGVKIYVDGTAQAATVLQNSLTGTVNNSASFEIGARSLTGQRFNGLMDDMRVYDASLTATQVGRLATAYCGADKLTPTATVTSSSVLNTSTYGDSVTFTATVSGGYSPTGTVDFMDGLTTIATGVALSSGTATYATSALSVGSHNITVVYSGDNDNAGVTSAPITQTVNKAVLTVTADNFSRDYGAADPIFTASYNGFQNSEVLATSGVTGSPSLTTTAILSSPVSGNPYTITAAVGSLVAANYSFSFVDGTLTINTVGTTTTTDLSAPTSSIVGDPVALTGSVTGGYNPSGTVQFMSGTTLLGSATLSGGKASISYTFTTVGSYSITANYLGDGNNNTSSDTSRVQVVDKASPSTSTVLSAPNSSIVGDPVSLTGSVTGGYGPTGSIEFFDGAASLGSATLSGGSAGISVIFTTVGSHNLTAVYGGDASNNGSTSPTATVQVVDKALPSTSTAVGVPNSSIVGDSVLLTASVTGGYLPSGTVNFLSGSTLLGSGTLLAGSATLSMTFAVAGDYSIHAEYLGDANNLGSSSSDAIIQVVDKFQSSVDLNLSSNLSFLGNDVALTAVVTGFFPSGTVTVRDGGTDIGTITLSNGSGSFVTSTLVLGSHSFDAVYGGDGNNIGSTSSSVALVVSPQPPENGGSRGHNVTSYSSVVHFVLANAGGGSGGRGRGNVAPGAFGGQGDNVIIPRQRILLCTLQRGISPQADSSLIIWIAQYMAPFFNLQPTIIEQALQDPALCSGGSSASVTPRVTVTSIQQIMPVDTKGIPVSTNDIWNRCIRNSISVSASDLTPMSCGRYHEGHYWTHPDSLITFFWADRGRQQLVSADRQPLLVVPVK
ncbi:MAG: Ig-like domain repeat protein [Candidatus Peribacter sp.]|nr:Ig-like domain repeat protein [Candidatus Peribacter sp.]